MPIEDVTLFDDVTATSPYTDNEIDCSSAISNNNSRTSGIVTLVVDELTPDGDQELVGYEMQMFLEERVATAPDRWVVRAESDPQKFKQLSKGQQVIKFEPIPVDSGARLENIELGAQDQIIYATQGTLPTTLRVRFQMFVTDAAKPQLSSIRFSGWLRMYD